MAINTNLSLIWERLCLATIGTMHLKIYFLHYNQVKAKISFISQTLCWEAAGLTLTSLVLVSASPTGGRWRLKAPTSSHSPAPNPQSAPYLRTTPTHIQLPDQVSLELGESLGCTALTMFVSVDFDPLLISIYSPLVCFLPRLPQASVIHLLACRGKLRCSLAVALMNRRISVHF